MISQNQMKNKILKNNKNGFVILFAVTISSIMLAVALGVTNIALKEVRFSTSARDTNDAFFAADNGIEYVLYRDKSVNNAYPAPASGSVQAWTEKPIGLGSLSLSCAIVTITKDYTSSVLKTTIISKGYNIGTSAGDCVPVSGSVERELKATY
jgi:Tfp pilus assembly protein PilX